jgi:hypothetical protein
MKRAPTRPRLNMSINYMSISGSMTSEMPKQRITVSTLPEQLKWSDGQIELQVFKDGNHPLEKMFCDIMQGKKEHGSIWFERTNLMTLRAMSEQKLGTMNVQA